MKDSPDITKLGEDNYVTWNSEMAAWFRTKGFWLLVKGKEVMPSSDAAEQLKWKEKASKAAGSLFLAVSPAQRTTIFGGEEDNPVVMWNRLKVFYVSSVPSAR
ncbi:hypothetical protein FA95DRAFT_1462641, partial [Auriscalpium vulgare]